MLNRNPVLCVVCELYVLVFVRPVIDIAVWESSLYAPDHSFMKVLGPENRIGHLAERFVVSTSLVDPLPLHVVLNFSVRIGFRFHGKADGNVDVAHRVGVVAHVTAVHDCFLHEKSKLAADVRLPDPCHKTG